MNNYYTYFQKLLSFTFTFIEVIEKILSLLKICKYAEVDQNVISVKHRRNVLFRVFKVHLNSIKDKKYI